MATQPIITVPDPSTPVIDVQSGRMTLEWFRVLQLVIQKLNKL